MIMDQMFYSVFFFLIFYCTFQMYDIAKTIATLSNLVYDIISNEGCPSRQGESRSPGKATMHYN